MPTIDWTKRKVPALAAALLVLLGGWTMSWRSPALAATVAPPYGLGAITQFDRLPFLQTGTLASGQSSFQRDLSAPGNGNADFNNFLYKIGTDNVMLDQKGPGTVYRIWATGFSATDYLKVYFDGETTPRINMLMKDFFAGTNAPFLAPLVGSDSAYSGGFVSYLPLPYSRSIRIQTSMTNYFNIGVHSYAPDTAVTTWTGTEDTTAARALWDNAGKDPKPTADNATVAGTKTLGAGTTQTLLDVAGPRSVSSIKLKVPGVVAPMNVTDNGRAFKGYSQFVAAIDPANSGVMLKRRLDYGVGDQKATVFVDGVNAGTWYDPGTDGTNRWRDSTFRIPATLTAGKSAVTVKVQFVSAAIDWNEFYYWVYSAVNHLDKQTDTLDVGDSASESGHSYTINTSTWAGTTSFIYPGDITDNGRAHKGTSNFTVALDPANTGATLTRRLDYGVGDQKATVFVDGVAAGTWYDAGANTGNHWRDSSFTIPSALTAGKSSVAVKVQFVSAAIDWNEFAYWAYSDTPGGTALTDYLDVGNSVSESAHGYTIVTQTWNGTQRFTYDTTDLLNNLQLKILWDGETTPSVNAPLGSLFGIGQFGAPQVQTHALPVGLGADGYLYLYFPMPFQTHATVQLSNNRSAALAGVEYEVKHAPFTDNFNDVAYFKTSFRSETPATLGQDTLILDTTGSGSFLGTTISEMGSDTSRGYLEGDERIYVDDNDSPAFQGTGTEDFFNAGWYFNHGPYAQPLSGNTLHNVINGKDQTAMYRFFLQDAVPFRTHLRASIEHGGQNDTTGNAWVLAYYYQKPVNRATLSDTLNVGNTASETGHAYAITTQTWAGTQNFTYAGVNNKVGVTDDGRAHKGTSQFTLALNPQNQGAILRRRLDYGIGNQLAKIYVDGTYAGDWYTGGSNTATRWADSDFLIPASLTAGKNQVAVQVQFVSAAIDWNEFTYWLYSLN
jgi:hypothetical protein